MNRKAPQSSQLTSELHNMGEALLLARTEKGLDIQEVAHTLIMSSAQIRGLETANQIAFHNLAFFIRGIEKYAQYLEIPESSEFWTQLDQIREFHNHLSASPAHREISTLAKSGFFKQRTSLFSYFTRNPVFWISVISLASLSMSLSSRIESESNRIKEFAASEQSATLDTAPEPKISRHSLKAGVESVTSEAQHSQASKEPSESSQNSNSQRQSAQQDTQSVLKVETKLPLQSAQNRMTLKFNEPSWVKYVVKDGTAHEKIYQPDEQLEIDPTNIESMVIGNAGATTITSGNTFIDLKSHSINKNGIARISPEDFSRLMN